MVRLVRPDASSSYLAACHAGVMTLPTSTRELTAEDWELVQLARATIDNNTDAEPDQDGVHTVGAAFRAADGQIFPGVNPNHFTGGPCAELIALGAARVGGARELTTIVAVGNHGRGPMGPCGRDRQVLFYCHPTIRVILPTDVGVRSVAIRSDALGCRVDPRGGAQNYDRDLFPWPLSHNRHRNAIPYAASGDR